VRLHGHKELYSGGYTDELLEMWAERVRAWHGGGQVEGIELTDPGHKLRKKRRDVFVFFDNDAKVDAPRDAVKLMKLLES
jgi:uncharacterized protein YecE (DUF72 family)